MTAPPTAGPTKKPKSATSGQKAKKGCSGRVRTDCSGNCVWDKRCKNKPTRTAPAANLRPTATNDVAGPGPVATGGQKAKKGCSGRVRADCSGNCVWDKRCKNKPTTTASASSGVLNSYLTRTETPRQQNACEKQRKAACEQRWDCKWDAPARKCLPALRNHQEGVLLHALPDHLMLDIASRMNSNTAAVFRSTHKQGKAMVNAARAEAAKPMRPERMSSELWSAISRVCKRMDEAMLLMTRSLLDAPDTAPVTHEWMLDLKGNNINMVIHSRKHPFNPEARVEYMLTAAAPRVQPYHSGYIVKCGRDTRQPIPSTIIRYEARYSAGQLFGAVNDSSTWNRKCSMRPYDAVKYHPVKEMSPSMALKFMLDDVPTGYDDHPPTIGFICSGTIAGDSSFSTSNVLRYASQVDRMMAKDVALILERFVLSPDTHHKPDHIWTAAGEFDVTEDGTRTMTAPPPELPEDGPEEHGDFEDGDWDEPPGFFGWGAYPDHHAQ